MNVSKAYSQGKYYIHTYSQNIVPIFCSKYLIFIGPDLSLLGSKFAAKGASIAFHKDDHALAAVERRGMSLNPGTLNTISIDKYEVIAY